MTCFRVHTVVYLSCCQLQFSKKPDPKEELKAAQREAKSGKRDIEREIRKIDVQKVVREAG